MAPNHDQSSSSTSTTLSGYASGSGGTGTSRRASDPVVRVAPSATAAQSHHSSHQRNAPTGMTRHRSGSYNGQPHNAQPGYQVCHHFQ